MSCSAVQQQISEYTRAFLRHRFRMRAVRKSAALMRIHGPLLSTANYRYDSKACQNVYWQHIVTIHWLLQIAYRISLLLNLAQVTAASTLQKLRLLKE
jgi:hypothetical protein